MLSAPRPIQGAWLSLDGARTKYALIRSVRAALVRTAVPGNDVTDIFAEVRNAEEVWAEVGSNVSHVSLVREKAPWFHVDSKQRLVRMLQLGCELWLPTAEQQERKWMDVYGAKLEEAKVNRQKLTGSRHAFG